MRIVYNMVKYTLKILQQILTKKKKTSLITCTKQCKQTENINTNT